MIFIPRAWQRRAGGVAASFIGIVVIASGTASADPALPSPSPAPAPTSPVQNLSVTPDSVNNRLTPNPPLAVSPTLTPADSGTLRDYLHAKGIELEPPRPQGFKALSITLPMPLRWTQVPDPNVPDAFAVIADRIGGNSVYTSNAQLVVYRLIGDFDPVEAIAHGYIDSQQLLAWKTTRAALDSFGGFPSAIIEGTYRENDMTLNTSRRHVIATSGADKYLVSLTVTTAASQAAADAPATAAIINGFRVYPPTTAAPTPAAANYSTPAELPEQSTARQPIPDLAALTPGLPKPTLGPQQ